MKTIILFILILNFFTSLSQSIGSTSWNAYYRCFDGTVMTNNNGVYQQVPNLNNIVSIAGGEHHVLFLNNNGNVWSLGNNERGQLGDGTLIDRSTPVQVSNISDVVSIAAGEAHSLFLKSDGSVWICGRNQLYQEFPDSAFLTISKVINLLYDVKEISAGGNFSLFLKNDGFVFGLGRNDLGQMGDGTIISKDSPTLLNGISNVKKAIAGMGSNSIYIKNDGSVWKTEEFTNNSIDLIPEIDNAISATTNLHTLILKSDGTVWAFGNNDSGQCGNGTWNQTLQPEQVIGITNIKEISSGYYHSLFLNEEGSVFFAGQEPVNISHLIAEKIEEICWVTDANKGVLGKLFYDNNSNCIEDEYNTVKLNTIGVVEPGNLIVQTYNNGYWFIDSLPIGSYTITFDTTGNFSSSCSYSQIFNVNNLNYFTVVNPIGVIANNPCPSPTISVNMPFMRPCFTNQQIYVQACNEYDATGVLPDAYSIVKLDPNLIFENASLPYTSLGNNQYRFEHDTLFPGECVNYTISTQVNCDAPLGLTLCTEANLYPVADCVLDTIPTPPTGEVTPCSLPWDQSSLSVEGWCANDSIYFTITNTGEFGGGDMECFSPVRIYIDGVPYLLDSIKLLGGETFTYSFLGNGSTWILEADQHPLHPGNSHPNAHVENCNPGNWTPELVNVFPQDDADPIKDIFCGIVTGSYDPNDKRGFPLGLNEEHEILPNQDLEYIIRFQNTGTDTAFNIVVRDTLDLDFDIFSITSGVASHNYTFRMYGPRVLEWTFPNILLPDSTTNEPLSNGFLSFKVKQKPNLSDGTLFTNDADIYFDFNEPIITNETSHKVQRRTFEPTNSINSLSKSKSTIKLYPNPTKQETTLSFSTYQKQVAYKLLNLSGQVVLEKTNLYGKEVKVNLSEVPIGMYLLEVRTENGSERLKVVRE